MGCCHYAAPAEVGDHARAQGVTRGALFTDKGVAVLEHVSIVRESLVAARIIELMKSTGIPNGVSGVGAGEADIPALGELFGGALRYW